MKSSKSEQTSVSHRTSDSRHSPFDRAPTVATIDLGSLRYNLMAVRRAVSSTCDILAVVKADAYGHGALEVTRTLIKSGILRFAVATPLEGIALREAGIEAPIVIMGGVFSEQLTDLVQYRLTPVLYDTDLARQFAGLMDQRKEPYPVHIKVDTGMGRLGILPEQALELLQSPLFKGALRAEGLMTHLADADNEDPMYTRLQIDRFERLVERLKQGGLSIPLVHAANSAAILRYPGAAFTAVRPGIMLYGYHTVSACSTQLRQVLTLTTRVVQVRTMAAGQRISYNQTYACRLRSRIAVLPVGYADGYSRALSNRGMVLIKDETAPIVGRVCMDMTMVDVTRIPNVQVGDEAVLIGRQGSKTISAVDVAAWQGTIPYEVLCAIGPRVRRVHLDPPEPVSQQRG
jgi:alanine racemase